MVECYGSYVTAIAKGQIQDSYKFFTLQDCIDLYNSGMEVIVSDGKIIDFMVLSY